MKAIQLFLFAITLNVAFAEVESKTGRISPLPPLPKGMQELKFDEFFSYPVGPGGLSFSDKLKSLDGKRVRIVGYMVSQDKPTPGCFLLAPLPVQLHEEHYGLADDLPASVLFVFDPANANALISRRPGLIVVSGALQIGNREEADGRISTVRLTLKSPPHELKLKKSAPARSTRSAAALVGR